MFSGIRQFKNTLIATAAIVGFGLAAAGQTTAHTISVGTFNAGAVGSVTVVLGSYHSPTSSAEGAIQLIAGPSGPSAVTSFTNLVTTKPVDLIDGTNNFFGSAGCCSDPAGTFNETSNLTGNSVQIWQSVTFTGLTAGTYTYQISGMNSDVWEDWGSLTNNWQGQLTITGETVVGQVSEPGALAALGFGLMGLGLLRRRKTN